MSTELFQFQHKYFQMRSPRNGRRETFFSLSLGLFAQYTECVYIFLVGHPHPILFCAYAHFFRLDAGAFRLFSTWDDTASVTQFHPHETPLKFFTNENMCTSTRSERERMEKRPLPATIIVYENWEHLENFSIILQTLNARFKHMFAHFCTETLSYGKHDNRRFSLCNYIYTQWPLKFYSISYIFGV